MTGTDRPRVLAIVVAYLPQARTLDPVLRTLLSQAGNVLLVDNSPANDSSAERAAARFLEDPGHLRMVRCGENLGIAAALNIGITAAIDEGFDYVLLSDQDSCPAPGMVDMLLAVSRDLERAGTKVGAVSPLYVDGVTGQAFGFQVQEPGRLFYSIVGAERGRPWIEVLSGITSGTLSRTEVFADVGLMREDYFIDYVDTEWFHRARSCGYQLFGTSLAVLDHRLGDSTFRVWYLRWRTVTGYSARRLYYRYRNFIAMLKERHIPLAWKLRAGWYWLGTAYAYLLFSPDRRRNAKYIIVGLWHGLRGRMGRYDG